MRQNIKKKLLHSIQTLMKVNDAVCDNIEAKNIELLMGVLVECQQSAIQVGEKIEHFEGEGTQTVTLLEQYCETLYQLSLVLEDINKARKLTKVLGNLLQKISNSIIYDIPVSPKEVIFLPYKASMWDSLESVWKAATEDPSCEVHVIPIPYYDKNADGTFGRMHYEGNDFPPYVPITSWTEYKLAEKYPDVAYIHNPYDNANKITSVYPDYYARELKKYVGTLVYIPYFISDIDVPEYLCVLPGTMYADKVIVASETEKSTYISEFKKAEQENNCVGAFGKLEDKFLVLGSPKMDKVRNTTIDSSDIPGDWEKIMENPDGSKKPVIFYNTTIQPLLTYKEGYLEKLQEVLDFFYEKRDECTLLWRPHPLMASTADSISTEISEKYRKMVEEYKVKGHGIYDDTPDIHRAIAVSDAYYGDQSSVAVLYKETGKPCMIQNVKVMIR